MTSEWGWPIGMTLVLAFLIAPIFQRQGMSGPTSYGIALAVIGAFYLAFALFQIDIAGIELVGIGAGVFFVGLGITIYGSRLERPSGD